MKYLSVLLACGLAFSSLRAMDSFDDKVYQDENTEAQETFDRCRAHAEQGDIIAAFQLGQIYFSGMVRNQVVVERNSFLGFLWVVLSSTHISEEIKQELRTKKHLSIEEGTRYLESEEYQTLIRKQPDPQER